MRLIDADWLQERLAKEPMENRTYLGANEIVVEAPTAYDVDKVLERLEELREEILSDTAYDNDTVNHYLCYADLMIEAVKSGGIG